MLGWPIVWRQSNCLTKVFFGFFGSAESGERDPQRMTGRNRMGGQRLSIEQGGSFKISSMSFAVG